MAVETTPHDPTLTPPLGGVALMPDVVAQPAGGEVGASLAQYHTVEHAGELASRAQVFDGSREAADTLADTLTTELGLGEHLRQDGDRRLDSVQADLNRTDAIVAAPQPRKLKPFKSHEEVHPVHAAELMEKLGVVKEAPRFEDQVNDETRMEPFYYVQPAMFTEGPKVVGPVPEIEGLRGLYSFLHGFVTDFAQSRRAANKSIGQLMNQAKSMMENLTFIGQKEYDEGVRGIAMLWKNYLDEDPDNKICVLTEVNKLERYKGERKSDDHMRDSVLDTFTDSELKAYSGRIVTSPEDLDGHDPQKTRIILIDDWTISGSQMRDVYRTLEKDETMRPYIDNDRVEVNLLVTTKRRLKNGLALDPCNPKAGSLKVRAYFLGHHASQSQTEQKGHITGLHSAVNYDCATTCADIARAQGKKIATPPLVCVSRMYRDATDRIAVGRDMLRRVSSSGVVRESE